MVVQTRNGSPLHRGALCYTQKTLLDASRRKQTTRRIHIKPLYLQNLPTIRSPLLLNQLSCSGMREPGKQARSRRSCFLFRFYSATWYLKCRWARCSKPVKNVKIPNKSVACANSYPRFAQEQSKIHCGDSCNYQARMSGSNLSCY